MDFILFCMNLGHIFAKLNFLFGEIMFKSNLELISLTVCMGGDMAYENMSAKVNQRENKAFLNK